MRRREFLGVLGGAAVAWPVAAHAQQKMPVIGFLNGQTRDAFTHLVAAFHEGLKETDYFEGRNVTTEYRWAEGHVDRLPALASDLVQRQVSVLVGTGGAHRAAKEATKTIPIVCSFGGDPVKDGFVVSLNRPGGNLTGVSVFTSQLEAKRMELLHELVPEAMLIGVMLDPTFSAAASQLHELQAAARAIGKRVHVVNVSTESEIEVAFKSLREFRVGGIVVVGNPFILSKRAQLVAQANQSGIPAIFENREIARAGGLMSYGTNVSNVYRNVGIYAGRILKGEKPNDLPVLLPTKFDMVVNLKTAKALGVTLPTSLLLRADEVIE